MANDKIKYENLTFSQTQKKILRYLDKIGLYQTTKMIDENVKYAGRERIKKNLEQLRSMKIIKKTKSPYTDDRSSYWQTNDMMTKSDWNKIEKGLKKK